MNEEIELQVYWLERDLALLESTLSASDDIPRDLISDLTRARARLGQIIASLKMKEAA